MHNMLLTHIKYMQNQLFINIRNFKIKNDLGIPITAKVNTIIVFFKKEKSLKVYFIYLTL